MKTLSLLLALLLLLPLARAGGGPENVLVLVNDASPESLAVAHYYLQRREIPRHHLVHLSLEQKDWGAIRPFARYQALVEQPVKDWLRANPTSRITTLVLARHVPVTVELELPSPLPKGLRDRQRSTAQMLAVMEVARPALRQAASSWRGNGNPYNGRDESIDPRRPLDAGGLRYPLYCAAALNAFSADDVKRMIDRAIEAERARPSGTVYLGRSRAKDPRGCYNGHFPALAQLLQGAGFKAEIVPHPGKSAALLVGRNDVLFFQYGQAGWDATFPAKNRYAPGAVVDNLTSVALTAACFDPKRKRGQTSMCHFLAAGATAVHGCVSEPYTIAFNGQHTHIQRYLAGYNLIESYYMAHPVLPWMNLIAGDPLLQPFAQRPVVTLGQPQQAAGQWKVSASARATRPGSRIAGLALYVDGRFAGEAAGDKGTFELPGFDPRCNTVALVATDDSKFRTQGRAVLRPQAPKLEAEQISFQGFHEGQARFGISGQPVPFAWYAPGAKRPHGAAHGTRLELALAGARRNTVEIWLPRDPSAPPAVKFFDLDDLLRKRALDQARKAQGGGDLIELARAIAVLSKLTLPAAEQAQLAAWRTEIEQRLEAKWRALEQGLPTVPGARDIERLAAFAERYAAFDVAGKARERLKALQAQVDALAGPLWQAAEKLYEGKQWSEALAQYRKLKSRYPVSQYAPRAEARIKELLARPEARGDLEAARNKQAAERLYRMASSYKANGMDALWKKKLEELIKRYPRSEQARQARRDLGRD